MLLLMKQNIELNNLQDRAEALILQWYVKSPILFPKSHGLIFLDLRGEPLPSIVKEQKPNVILAAECVYFEPAFPLLMQTLKDLFVLNADAVVYFCFKKRRRADLQFVKMAKKSFKVEEIFDEDRPIFSRQSLFLFAFRSKPQSLTSQGGKND